VDEEDGAVITDEMTLARIAMSQRKYADAELLYRSQVEKHPDDQSLKHMLVQSMIPQKKFQESDSMLRKWIEKDSNNAGNYWYKGLLAEHQLQDSTVIVWFKKFIVKSAKSHNENPKAWLHVGSGYRRMMHKTGISAKQVDDLVSHYEKYLEKYPQEVYGDDMRWFIEQLKSRKPKDGELLLWDEQE
jgi:tetratricopeptide (TPR) repeat protein